MTDAAKVAALREALMAALRDELWEDQSEGDPDVEAATADRILARPDVRAALSASDSGEVAGLRAILDIEEGYQPARLAAFLCQDAQDYGYDHGANPTLADFDARWPSCPRHQAMAANLLRAALTRPVSEVPEAAPSSETRRVLERLDRGVTRATRHTDGMVAARTMHLLIAELLREGASDD